MNIPKKHITNNENKLCIKKAYDFSLKYKLPLTKQTLKDVHCGLHSGIPECCILHWYIFWCPIITCTDHIKWDIDENYLCKIRKNASKRDKILLNIWNQYTLSGNHVGYVRCPACIVNNRVVEIKKCKPTDHNIDWSVYLKRKSK